MTPPYQRSVADKGFLTIAAGKTKYIQMAKELAVSLILTNPHLPRAVVTDSDDAELKKLYHHLIPIDSSFGVGLVQKLALHKYTPFEHTFFIDADCLVLRNIDFLWELFKGHEFSVLGRKVFSGPALGTTVENLKARLPIDYVTIFNGGVYYFKKGKLSEEVYKIALDFFVNKYDEFGLQRYYAEKKRAEETVISVAMGLCKVEPAGEIGTGMYTPIGLEGAFRVDALSGYCEFIKEGRRVTPSIMHFGMPGTSQFHYKREVRKLRLLYHTHLPKRLLSLLINGTHNPCYIAYVFVYRLLKMLLKGERFKIKPLMPMFRFE